MTEELISFGLGGSNAEVIERARKQLEDRISEHLRAIIGMKTQLNTLIPISRFPPELLSEIFMHYIRPSGLYSRHPTLYCWIRIAHICHHWREVALQTPRLWTTLEIGRLEPILELLSRSKQAPLSIKAHYSHAREGSLSQVFKAFPRIQDVELTLSPRQYDQLASEFPKVAPQLRRIVIVRSSDSFGMPSDLPKIFDNCSLPSLENLQIKHYKFNWTHSILVPTLTRLTILSLENSNRTRPMLDAIQTMQLLQHLDLTCVGPSQPDSVDTLPPITHQITLPVLLSLRLSDEILTCASIIQQIVFPSTTTVSLDVTAARSESQLALFAPVIYGKLTGTGVIGPCPPILSAGLWQHWEGPFSSQLACWRTTHPPAELCSNTHPAPFRITFRSSRFTLAMILKQFNSIIPAVKVNTFSIAGAGGLDPDADWTIVLANMPNIVTMRIANFFPDNLVKLLSTRNFLEAPKKGSRRRSNFLLEHLRVLTLERIRFDYDDDEFLEALVKALKARRRNHHRLETLRIERCLNVNQPDIHVLRSGVGQVIWDGYVEEDPDEMSDEDDILYRDSDDDYMDDYMDDFGDYDVFPPPFGLYDYW